MCLDAQKRFVETHVRPSFSTPSLLVKFVDVDVPGVVSKESLGGRGEVFGGGTGSGPVVPYPDPPT